jgi:hypothetical protein
MKKGARAYVVLAGGLGNQLFQASALLGLDSRYRKLWLNGVSKPRLSNDGSPESLTLLDLPNRVAPILFQGLLQKIVNLNLKQSVPDLEGINRTLSAKIVKKFSEIIFSIVLFEKIRIINLVDEIPTIQKKAGSILLIGYFQTSIYAQSVKNLVISNGEKIRHGRVEALDLHRDSENTSPLIIHVRRSDYQFDRNFGLLSDIYYRSALKEIPIKTDSIWVFSDDIEYARKMLSQIAPSVTRWISDVDHSSSMSLLAMSYGNTYIIANSTFSWWGAYLSGGSPLVYYPESWLKGIPHRKDLFPKNWIPIEGKYEKYEQY